MVSLRVLVCQHILVLHQVVGQNVRSTQNVEVIKPVFEKNVRILAQAFVEFRLNAV
jgi:hypothetical protein